jgi:ParB family chromosome partitioning protein
VTADPRASGGLGRGLASLIPNLADQRPREIAVSEIRRNPYQPRQRFDEEALAGLAASIAEHGVLQPILVTQVPGGFELVAGERRLRAAEMAGLERIPAMIRTVGQHDQLALALVENLQRADLNAMDEARAFRRLSDEFGMTQDEIAVRVGRSRPAITNTLRLLEVSPAVQAAIEDGRISEGHGRAIASLSTHPEQDQLLKVVVERGLSVRRTEELARDNRVAPPRTPQPDAIERDPELDRLETGLRSALGTKVTVASGPRGGRITIEYYSADDLTRIYERLTGAEQ